ncbi:MAG: hypothetical protein K9L74_04890 [Candidatus Izimaplasma sp.]|nr:hypothetical protein [Candidatus Izimaplasma bacterium]
MKTRQVSEKLRYKDKGTIEYRITEGFDGEGDCLELEYSDHEKTYSWEYHFQRDGNSPLQHIKNISYESLKEGFVETINEHGKFLEKGEYQLLKESIVIFVSHKHYIVDVCKKNGLC